MGGVVNSGMTTAQKGNRGVKAELVNIVLCQSPFPRAFVWGKYTSTEMVTLLCGLMAGWLQTRKASAFALLTLAYQSFGVVYGDLSVSSLYVFRSTFGGRLSSHVTEGEIYGVLSFIFWTLTLVPLVKYAFVVLSADDNGEGAILHYI